MANSPNLNEMVTTTHQNRSAKKKRTPKATPAQRAKVGTVMREAAHGELHSGSKTGPIVKSRKQAQAIAMSEAGLSNKKPKHGARMEPHNKGEIFPGTSPGGSGPEGVEGLLAGSGGPTRQETRRPYGFTGEASVYNRGQPSHSFPSSPPHAHGWGHQNHQRQGHLRTSGRGHQIGKK